MKQVTGTIVHLVFVIITCIGVYFGSEFIYKNVRPICAEGSFAEFYFGWHCVVEISK